MGEAKRRGTYEQRKANPRGPCSNHEVTETVKVQTLRFWIRQELKAAKARMRAARPQQED